MIINEINKEQTEDDFEDELHLGKAYLFGLGIEKYEQLAVEFFEKAAFKGVVEAQRYLAKCYLDGIGKEANATLAVAWYQKAALQGDSIPQNNLAYCYQLGLGITRDFNNKPIGVAGYEITLVESLSKELKENLPTIEDIEAEFGEEESDKKNILNRETAVSLL